MPPSVVEHGDARPENGRQSGCPSQTRPIDLVHLARRTRGDNETEAEVLGLVVQRFGQFSIQMDMAQEADRSHLAQTVGYVARGIGAFPLANAAKAVELCPADTFTRAALTAEMQRAVFFINALLDRRRPARHCVTI